MEPAHGPHPASRAELEAQFLSALPVIEQTIRFVCGRHRLSSTEQEDFASEVKLAFIEDDYRVLAAFQGRSSLRTYLVVVIQRLFLDYRRKIWGKWHPSAEAMRLGPLAQRLEILVYRDGHSASEACEMLRTNLGVAETIDTLLDLAARLPVRQPGRVRASADGQDSSAALAAIPASEVSNPHASLESDETIQRCQSALGSALEAMAPDDRVVLRLRFEDDVSVADIARTLTLDQKKLYRRIESLLSDLRRALEGAGLRLDQVRRLIDSGQCHLRLPQKKPASLPETLSARPSTVGATS